MDLPNKISVFNSNSKGKALFSPESRKIKYMFNITNCEKYWKQIGNYTERAHIKTYP